jgi:NitT/TauT family transport system ATP-binding protein
MPPKVIAHHVEKTYETATGPFTAIHDFSLTVDDGEFVCIVGPSGCGKSTFLRIVAGLDQLTGGSVQIVPGSDPRKPTNNVVFQEYAIFPWKTLLDNVAFGLQMRGIGKRERHATALDWLERVGLRKFAHYYPHQISGGMKQRVSIARALANDPEVLLMDEPLGALDAQTRTVMQEELVRLTRREPRTTLFITHAVEEAVYLSDRVVVLARDPGRLREIVDVAAIRRSEGWDTMPIDAVMDLPSFTHLRTHVWRLLRDQIRPDD